MQHLTRDQKLEIAEGAPAEGASLEHLEACEQCFVEVEQLGAETQQRRESMPLPAEAPHWFREAGLAAFEELGDAIAQGPRTERRDSGTRPTERRARSRRFVRLPLVTGLGLLAVAAGWFLSIRTPDPVAPSPGQLDERGGGVSAHLFCLARPGVELGPVDWCPTGSELTIRAEPPLGRSLSTVSVVACADRRPCERVSSAHFEREEVQLLAGPKLEIPGKIDVVVVWSDQDLGQLLAGQVAHVGEVPALALPKGWIQAGFSLRTSDAPSP